MRSTLALALLLAVVWAIPADARPIALDDAQLDNVTAAGSGSEAEVDVSIGTAETEKALALFGETEGESKYAKVGVIAVGDQSDFKAVNNNNAIDSQVGNGVNANAVADVGQKAGSYAGLEEFEADTSTKSATVAKTGDAKSVAAAHNLSATVAKQGDLEAESDDGGKGGIAVSAAVLGLLAKADEADAAGGDSDAEVSDNEVEAEAEPEAKAYSDWAKSGSNWLHNFTKTSAFNVAAVTASATNSIKVDQTNVITQIGTISLGLGNGIPR